MNYWFSSETTSIIILFHTNGRKSIFSSLSQEVLSFELVTLLPICRIFDIFRCFTLSPQKSWTEICRILIANLLTFRGSGRWTTCSQYIRCHNPSCLCGVLLVIYFLPRYPINSKNSLSWFRYLFCYQIIICGGCDLHINLWVLIEPVRWIIISIDWWMFVDIILYRQMNR